MNLNTNLNLSKEEENILYAKFEAMAFSDITQKLGSVCFERCVERYNETLDNNEAICINNCPKKYLQTSELVNKFFVENTKRIQEEMALQQQQTN